MYFLTRAMAFFAGWSWITLCRDLSTLLAYHDAQTPARNYSGQFLVWSPLRSGRCSPSWFFLIKPYAPRTAAAAARREAPGDETAP